MSESDDRPRRVDGLTGVVRRGPFGAGSKSERIAVWIDTDDGSFVLRRKGEPTYGDRALDRYVGHRVVCDGFIVDYTLLAELIRILPSR